MLNTIVPRDPDSVSLAQRALDTARTAATFGPWLARHREAVVRPLIDAVVKELRSDATSTRRIGAIGFCRGARYAVLLGGDVPAVECVRGVP